LTTKEIQQLLGEDEALLVFLAADKESYVFALTRYKFDWKVIALGTKALSEKIAAFRHGLDVNEINRAIQESRKAGLFDLGLANELYATLLGPVEPLVKDKKHLLIVPTGALTALPFHLLVTQKPAVSLPDNVHAYRDADWLIKRQAISVLPSVVSLKTLRAFAHEERRKNRWSALAIQCSTRM
jgi:hypothetical protein